MSGDVERLELVELFDDRRGPFLDVSPFSRLRRAELAGEPRLEREAEDESLKAPERERLRSPYAIGEVELVEAGEVGLDVAPVSEDDGGEARYSPAITS